MRFSTAYLAFLALTTGGCGNESWAFDVGDAEVTPDSASVEDGDNGVDSPGNDVDSAGTGADGAGHVADGGDKPSAPDAARDAGFMGDAPPACLSDDDCPADAPLCNASGACIRCSSDLDCANVVGSPVCNVSTGGCVQCLSRSNCSNPMLSVCDPATERCVECLDNDDCGSESFCQSASRTCAPMI